MRPVCNWAPLMPPAMSDPPTSSRLRSEPRLRTRLTCPADEWGLEPGLPSLTGIIEPTVGQFAVKSTVGERRTFREGFPGATEPEGGMINV